MKKRFEIIIYTAASQEYADDLLNYMESEWGEFFAYRLYDKQCVTLNRYCVFKSIEILCKGRDLKDIIIIDNTVRNFSLSIKNGIPIKNFINDDGDKELVYLAKYLRLLSNESNMKNIIKSDFVESLLKRNKEPT